MANQARKCKKLANHTLTRAWSCYENSQMGFTSINSGAGIFSIKDRRREPGILLRVYQGSNLRGLERDFAHPAAPPLGWSGLCAGDMCLRPGSCMYTSFLVPVLRNGYLRQQKLHRGGTGLRGWLILPAQSRAKTCQYLYCCKS